jgi:hypothetical protein
MITMELSGRRLLVMGVLAVLLALPVAGIAQAGNGHEPTLKLDPPSGLPDFELFLRLNPPLPLI